MCDWICEKLFGIGEILHKSAAFDNLTFLFPFPGKKLSVIDFEAPTAMLSLFVYAALICSTMAAIADLNCTVTVAGATKVRYH